MPNRNHSNVAVATTLDTGINAAVTSLVVADASGYPTAPFHILIDEGLATEEIILVGEKAGTTFSSCTRGIGGTSAASHSAGAAIVHVVIASDIEDALDHRFDSPATAGDTDASTSAIHHTLGTGANQAAAGNHSHSAADHGSLTGLSDDDHSIYQTFMLIPFSKSGTLTTTTDTSAARFRCPVAMTIVGVTAAVVTAPTGAAIILDVHKNGTTIYTTQGNRPQIAISANNSGSESTNMDVTSVSAGDYLTVNIDQVGSTVAGADLVVTLRLKRA